MRRLTYAALAAALALAACSDQSTESPTEPTGPTPDQTFGSTCTVAPFPLQTVAAQILEVFPNGRLRIEANARAAGIKLFWDTCHEGPARQMAVSFIEWMNENFSRGRLRGATAEEVQTLTVTVLNGVGVLITAPTTTTGDIGVGLYDPAKTTNTIITTASKVALTELEPQAFESSPNEVRLIIVERKPDNPPGIVFEGPKFPPYFDYDAIKLTGTTTAADKVLKEEKKAVIAFCLLDEIEYPDGSRIGHNPVQGAPHFPFELLDPFSLRDESGGLTDLGRQLNCGNLHPDGTEPEVIGGFGARLPEFAQGAWGITGRLVRPLARALLLPQQLQAATVAYLGPIGGKTTSLSPFGVVEVGTELNFQPGGDPVERSFEAGVRLGWGCEGEDCSYPAVRLLDGEGAGIGEAQVTVSLLRLVGEGTEEAEFQVASNVVETTNSDGVAVFDNLVIADAGNYQLSFQSSGAAPLISGVFEVTGNAEGIIQGNINSAVFGPLAGAVVTASDGESVVGSATSNSDGQYQLSGLPLGPLTVSVTGTPTSCFRAEPREVTTESGANIENFTLTCRNVAYLLFETPDYEIARMNADGTGQVRLTDNDLQELDPSWSPDGAKLAFSLDGEIYVMNADGGMTIQLTDDEFLDRTPAWSPDGSQIAYTTRRAAGTSSIFVMNSDGSGDPSRLTPDGLDAGPSWSPDGTKIAFGRNSQIYVMNADGSAPTQLTDNELSNGGPAWSPDGTKIAYSGGVPGGEEGNNDGTYEIYVIPAAGGTPTALTDNSDYDVRPAWSPDGSKIIYVSDLFGWTVFSRNSDGTGTPAQFTPPGHSVEAVTW